MGGGVLDDVRPSAKLGEKHDGPSFDGAAALQNEDGKLLPLESSQRELDPLSPSHGTPPGRSSTLTPTFQEPSPETTCEGSMNLRCLCGKCNFQVPLRLPASGSGHLATKSVRCHCGECRRFHSTSFAAYAVAPKELLSELVSGATIQSFVHTCGVLGPVRRLRCGECQSKLATVPLEGPLAESLLVTLGAVEDDSMPKVIADHWHSAFEEHGVHHAAPWSLAQPSRLMEDSSSAEQRTDTVTGGCACGACTFRASVLLPAELQHCYCKLCRRLGGAPVATFVPCSTELFEWTSTKSLALVPTTDFAKRHMCTSCGVFMTLVYNYKPERTWPVLGALDDASLPRDQSSCWSRVIHIHCAFKQPWYQLPDDGLPRLETFISAPETIE